MLGIAYSASIGGVGTLIGTPPNALLASFLQSTYEIQIDFFTWMQFGIPVVIVGLPINDTSISAGRRGVVRLADLTREGTLCRRLGSRAACTMGGAHPVRRRPGTGHGIQGNRTCRMDRAASIGLRRQHLGTDIYCANSDRVFD